VHRLDARVKLLAALGLATAAVAGSHARVQAALLAMLALTFVMTRLPVALAWRSVRGAAWLLGFVVVANVAWSWVARRADWAAGEGAVAGAGELTLLGLRLTNLLVIATLLTATTVPLDAAEAVERLLLPLRRLRVPVHDVGMVLGLSLSFVPLFQREATALSDAHRIKRGTARWRPADRARAAVPLLVPLFLAVLRRADDLAVALDARSYAPGATRTSLVPGRCGAREWIALAATTAVLLACIGWR
jgi:energy-coupling factor transport system permease protein